MDSWTFGSDKHEGVVWSLQGLVGAEHNVSDTIIPGQHSSSFLVDVQRKLRSMKVWFGCDGDLHEHRDVPLHFRLVHHISSCEVKSTTYDVPSNYQPATSGTAAIVDEEGCLVLHGVNV